MNPDQNPEAILCVPGPWMERSDFLRAIMDLEPVGVGEFMFAGGILADLARKDHVLLEFDDADSHMTEAFRVAGQGRLSEETLEQVDGHAGVAYLHFPLDWLQQRERLIRFSRALQRAGGFAIKVESAGVAHEWERWFELLEAGHSFGLYCSAVLLIGGETHYYSCGMHHFGLPECSVPRKLPMAEAAALMNRFNLYQIDEAPQLESGHTFSLEADAPRHRLALKPDIEHEPGDLFHNPHGVWVLEPR